MSDSVTDKKLTGTVYPDNRPSPSASHLYVRPPLPIHGGEMRGIPGDIGGNSMSIPPKVCPGEGDFSRFSMTILITPRHSSATTHTPGPFRTLATVSKYKNGDWSNPSHMNPK